MEVTRSKGKIHPEQLVAVIISMQLFFLDEILPFASLLSKKRRCSGALVRPDPVSNLQLSLESLKCTDTLKCI